MPDRNCSLDVSRETLEKLEAFEALVGRWSQRINLVSRHDLGALWERHIRDSAQLVARSDSPTKWLDLGSGGGFPGIVVAVILSDVWPDARVTLVESDKRKCAFLTSAKRSLDLTVDILPDRIENIPDLEATTLSARALAPLEKLAGYAHRHLTERGVALFPKGKGWKNEVVKAKEKWSFDIDVIESITDPEAAVLRLRNIQRQ